MRQFLLVHLICLSNVLVGQCQIDADSVKEDFLTFELGVSASNYHATGIRTYFEYQREVKGPWYLGVAYEHSRFFNSSFFAPEYSKTLRSDYSVLCLETYYNFQGEVISMNLGLGLGGVHIAWGDGGDSFGLAASATVAFLIHISPKVSLQLSPFFIVFPNRFYYSPVQIKEFNSFYATNLIPIGIRFRL
ncbi:hypothetical protein [Halocola ammonii]